MGTGRSPDQFTHRKQAPTAKPGWVLCGTCAHGDHPIADFLQCHIPGPLTPPSRGLCRPGAPTAVPGVFIAGTGCAVAGYHLPPVPDAEGRDSAFIPTVK